MQRPIAERPKAPLQLAASDCLLGHAVRYDGSEAAAEFAGDELARYFKFQGICPEVGIGLSVPRQPIALYQSSPSDSIRVLQVDSPDRDFTASLQGFAQRKLAQLNQVDGYILMKNSPSCGLHTVKVQDASDTSKPPQRVGRGAYAERLTQLLPQLPVEENERLFDPKVRGNFYTQTFAYAHWRRVQQAEADQGKADHLDAGLLVAFHSRYKYLLMAHSQQHYRRAGQLLSNLRPYSDVLAQRYIEILMAGLRCQATQAGHLNVLQHLAGYLKAHASSRQRSAVAEAIQGFAQGTVELDVPVQLIKACLGEYLEVPQLRYAWQQLYFEPYPVLGYEPLA